MGSKVRHRQTSDQLTAQDTSWLELKDLRELVRQADERGWSDRCLISHSGGGEHPTLRGIRTATYILVEGPE